MFAAAIALPLAFLATPADAEARSDRAIAAIEAWQQAFFERVAPSVVFVATSTGFGSGFFVGEGGLILTNRHVVGDAETVNVVLSDGRKLVGKVVERAAANIDLALIEVADAKRQSKGLAIGRFEELRIGSFVASVGHGEGAVWTFNTGMVSNIYPVGSERPLFQTQIPLNPGNSGGPIVDRMGRVVGVVTAGIMAAQNLNFGIRIDVALKSLERLWPECACVVVRAPPSTPVFADGILAGTGPLVFVPAKLGQTIDFLAVVGGRPKKARVRFPDTRVIDLSRF